MMEQWFLLAIVRYIQPEDITNDRTMVLVSYYGEDNGDNIFNYASPSSGSYKPSLVIPKGSYQMDHNTLWFIADGMARPVGPPRPRPYNLDHSMPLHHQDHVLIVVEITGLGIVHIQREGDQQHQGYRP